MPTDQTVLIDSARNAIALLQSYVTGDAEGFRVLLDNANHRDTLCALLYLVVHNSDVPKLMPVLQATLVRLAEEYE